MTLGIGAEVFFGKGYQYTLGKFVDLKSGSKGQVNSYGKILLTTLNKSCAKSWGLNTVEESSPREDPEKCRSQMETLVPDPMSTCRVKAY